MNEKIVSNCSGVKCECENYESVRWTIGADGRHIGLIDSMDVGRPYIPRICHLFATCRLAQHMVLTWCCIISNMN